MDLRTYFKRSFYIQLAVYSLAVCITFYAFIFNENLWIPTMFTLLGVQTLDICLKIFLKYKKSKRFRLVVVLHGLFWGLVTLLLTSKLQGESGYDLMMVLFMSIAFVGIIASPNFLILCYEEYKRSKITST